MKKYILSFNGRISLEGKVIGICNVSYHYNGVPGTGQFLWNACYVSACVNLLEDEGISCFSENWADNVLTNWQNNVQGKTLVQNVLKKHYKTQISYQIDVQIENYVVTNLNGSKHIHIEMDHEHKQMFISLPDKPMDKSYEVRYGSDFQELANENGVI
jgi:hypothetical protein